MIRAFLTGVVIGVAVGWLRSSRTAQPALPFSYLDPPEFHGNPDGSREITYGLRGTFGFGTTSPGMAFGASLDEVRRVAHEFANEHREALKRLSGGKRGTIYTTTYPATSNTPAWTYTTKHPLQ